MRKNNFFFAGCVEWLNNFKQTDTRDSLVSKPELMDTQRTLENWLKEGTIGIAIDQRGMILQTNWLMK